MLRPRTRAFAEPGRLLVGTLEKAAQSETPGKSWYQVRVESVEPARSDRLVEILDIPPNWLAEPGDIINRHRFLQVDHQPLDQVYLSWQGFLYGPFQTTNEPDGDSGKFRVRFATAPDDPAVLKIPELALQRVPAGRHHRIRVEVSLVKQPPAKTANTKICIYHLVPVQDFRLAVTNSTTRLVLESDEMVIRRVAKTILSRTKKQELTRLLDELANLLDSTSEPGTMDAKRAVAALSERLHEEVRAADELAADLLASGVLDERLQHALQQAEQEHIQKQTARLQAEIDARLETGRKDLKILETSKETVRRELETIHQIAREEVEKEQATVRQQFERDCRAREEELESRRRELAQQSDLLQGSVTQVARELADNREGLVKQFLAIVPLLQQLDLLQPPNGKAPNHWTHPETLVPSVPSVGASQPTHAPDADQMKPFVLPSFVVGGPASAEITELQFFERFCKHVEDSGFRHRRLDLAGFHLSVKCNDLTILGGQPGTGKSSLPRLYTEALTGDEYDEGKQRFLHVGVSPSWLDMRDLLGHTNALDRRFQPAECGLYQLLIWAQEEGARRGLDTRLYIVCLDEMNLAQVEHYFSGFLQALERPPGQREVRCFSPELVSPCDPFARWPILLLPRSLRFIGTVNFDETTRQLSQRVLDRANLIRLHPLSFSDIREVSVVRPTGPAVTLKHFRDWVAPSSLVLKGSAGDVLDRLREPLARLGCPLNQRRIGAIRKLLANVPAEICKPEQALDLQIAQRILPQARNLFRPGARQALEAIRKLLQARPADFPESLQLLDEIQASEFSDELLAQGGEE